MYIVCHNDQSDGDREQRNWEGRAVVSIWDRHMPSPLFGGGGGGGGVNTLSVCACVSAHSIVVSRPSSSRTVAALEPLILQLF